MISFLGKCTQNFIKCLKYVFTGQLRFSAVIEQAASISYDSLPISLIISFIVLILSIFLQISINYSGKLEEILFECWIFCVSYFAFSTYRIINLLLKIIFTTDAQEKISKNEKSEEQKRQQLQRINKLNRQKKNN